MVSQATRQRKGVGPPKSGDVVQTMANMNGASLPTTGVAPTVIPKPAPKVAKVKRNKFGTGPFDEHWLNLDVCGLFCASITYMLHMYGVYATCLILIPPWMSTVDENGVRTISMMGHLNRVAFTLVAFLAVSAHFKAMTTNPGAVPPDAIPLEEANENEKNINGEKNGDSQNSSLMVEDPPQQPRKGRRLCRRCNSFKPKRAHHCSICKRCIIKMDHHCPWVNNCVGIGNHKYFLLFIFYTCLSCVYSLTLIGMRFFDCMGRHGHIRTHHITCLDKPSQLMNILGLFIEAILFGLFTSCMMFDQAGVVMTKMTHIDRLKGGGESSGSSTLAGVIEVFGLNPKKTDFGGRFRADWLSPFHRTCFPSTLYNEMMGFCKPCGGRRSKANDQGDTEMSPMVRNSVADIV
mmetsp:Transcript_4566/g.13130  ORF Transcript_4566/g.13130 Transcript_4566/m.13130 type:complete len:405 (+) Transcript_4566:157-1371(+)